jgi:hypothetical protein
MEQRRVWPVVAACALTTRLAAGAQSGLVAHPIAPIHGPVLLLRDALAEKGGGWHRHRVLAPAVSLLPQTLLEVDGSFEPHGFAGRGTLVGRCRAARQTLIAIDLATGRVTELESATDADDSPLHLGDHGVLQFRSDPPHDWHIDGADVGKAWLSLQSASGGAARAVVTLPKGVERSLLRARLSPDGRHVAWATPLPAGDSGAADALKPASLTVVDVASGKAVRSWQGIEVAISPFSSSMATLEFTWLDDRTLRYGDTELAAGGNETSRSYAGLFRWIDVALDREQALATWPIGPMELSHDQPNTEPVPVSPTDALAVARGARALRGRRHPAVVSRRSRAFGRCPGSGGRRFRVVSRLRRRRVRAPDAAERSDGGGDPAGWRHARAGAAFPRRDRARMVRERRAEGDSVGRVIGQASHPRRGRPRQSTTAILLAARAGTPRPSQGWRKATDKRKGGRPAGARAKGLGHGAGVSRTARDDRSAGDPVLRADDVRRSAP